MLHQEPTVPLCIWLDTHWLKWWLDSMQLLLRPLKTKDHKKIHAQHLPTQLPPVQTGSLLPPQCVMSFQLLPTLVSLAQWLISASTTPSKLVTKHPQPNGAALLACKFQSITVLVNKTSLPQLLLLLTPNKWLFNSSRTYSSWPPTLPH